jgi:hypothetical protein
MALSREYDLIVSLGDNCAPAFNIRRVFGRERAYPFDWWVTPYYAMMRLLAENYAGLFQPEHLVRAHDDKTVLCRHYGLWHHHDFTKDADDRVLPGFLDEIPQARSKTKALLGRLFEDSAGRDVLFLRSSLIDGGERAADPALVRDRAVALWTALAGRYGLARRLDLLTLAPVTAEEIAMPQGRILIRDLGERIGDSVFWDDNYTALFQALGLSLKPLAALEHSGDRLPWDPA